MIVIPMRYAVDIFDLHGYGDIIVMDDDGGAAHVMRPVSRDGMRGFVIRRHPGRDTPPPNDDDPTDPDPGEPLPDPKCELAA